MTAQQRAVPRIVLGLLTTLAAALPLAAQVPPVCPAGPPPVSTPEPPLAGPPPEPLPLQPAPAELPPRPVPSPAAPSLVPAAPVPAPASPVPQDPPTPVVSIRVRVPADVAAGQEIEYHIAVENQSAGAAHHVVVRDPLPANVRLVRARPEPAAREPELVWRLGTLDGGARREIVLVLAPTGGEEVKNCARVQFEHGQCVSTRVAQVARPALRLQRDGPTQALLYDALTYKLTVTNSGDTELTNVLLADVLPAGLEHASHKDRLSWILGTLAHGQSRSVDYQVIAKSAGRLCDRVIATAAGGLHQEVESCVQVGEAKLHLDMTGPERRYLNQPASYQIRVTNPGTAALSNLVLSDPVPDQVRFVRATAGGRSVANRVQWALGDLAPGASRTVEVVLQAQAAGRVCNQATATADRGLAQQAEVCTEFFGVPALSLQVEDSKDPVELGGTTEYRITVRNQGTTPATNVRVRATVPEQMELTQAAGAAASHKEGSQVVYEPLTVQAGAAARYRLVVRARQEGDVRLRVELTADQLPAGPVQQEESTTIYAHLPSAPGEGVKEPPRGRLEGKREGRPPGPAGSGFGEPP